MSVQRRNDAMVSILSADVQMRYETQFALANAIPTMQMFPELRGAWPMSSIDESGNARDLSGQGRTLTNTAGAGRAVQGIMPYASFNGTTQYFTRADEAGLDITGGLTLGLWAWVADPTLGGTFMAKMGAAGNYSYLLDISASAARFLVSSDGTAVASVSGSSSILASYWHFFAGRFTPNNELAVFYNGEETTNIVGVPAAIFNGSAAFTIGARSVPSNFLQGRVALAFLCAAALSDAVILNFYNQTRALLGR